MAYRYANQQAKEIVLGDDFGEVAVRANGKIVRIHFDGSVDRRVTNTKEKKIILGDYFGEVVIEANGRIVHIHADGNAESTPGIGKELPDGWIYLGQNPDHPDEDYALEPIAGALIGIGRWASSKRHAAALEKRGNKNAHLPTETELTDIFSIIARGGRGKNDAAKLCTDNGRANSVYWSSTPPPPDRGILPKRMQVLDFHDGMSGWLYTGHLASIRCVRSQPRPDLIPL